MKLNLLIICLALITFSSASTISIDNPSIPHLNPSPQTAVTTSVNYSLVNVNNSDYLQGYQWSNAPYPSALYSTYNSTYATWAYNQTYPGGNCPSGQVVQNTTTGGVQCVAMSSGTYNITYEATTNQWNGNYSILAGAVNNDSYLSTFNSTYDAKADYQFLNNNFNGSGNFTTTGTGTFDGIELGASSLSFGGGINTIDGATPYISFKSSYGYQVIINDAPQMEVDEGASYFFYPIFSSIDGNPSIDTENRTLRSSVGSNVLQWDSYYVVGADTISPDAYGYADSVYPGISLLSSGLVYGQNGIVASNSDGLSSASLKVSQYENKDGIYISAFGGSTGKVINLYDGDNELSLFTLDNSGRIFSDVAMTYLDSSSLNYTNIWDVPSGIITSGTIAFVASGGGIVFDNGDGTGYDVLSVSGGSFELGGKGVQSYGFIVDNGVGTSQVQDAVYDGGQSRTNLRVSEALGINVPGGYVTSGYSFENNGNSLFNGNINATRNITVGQLITLKAITLPACGALTNGSIARNSTKFYACDGVAWNALY